MCGIWLYFSRNDISKCNISVLYNLFNNLKNRGPDFSSFNILKNVGVENGFIGFHRLSIIDPNEKSNQPFIIEENFHKYLLVCNGEIYNYKELIRKHNLKPKTKSDCEVVLLLYIKYGIKTTLKLIQGEYAFIIIDFDVIMQPTIYVARDQYGVRPLFYGRNENGIIGFSSEMKGLINKNVKLFDEIDVFSPASLFTYFNNKINLESFYTLDNITSINIPIHDIYIEIYNRFYRCVEKRLNADRPLGCLLSGGLDSSIVSAISADILKRRGKMLNTFTIGLEDGTDLKYARDVAKYINSNHTEYIINVEDALKVIDEVIYTTESYDITTIRASVWQFLLGKKIKENTNIKVLLVGEGSDELFQGYIYFKKAPNEEEAKKDSKKLLNNIHRFDGLRVDRCMSGNGLEVRLPFLDTELTNFIMSIDSKYIIPQKGMEKALFRNSFKDIDLLPEHILYRPKEAFSDAVSSIEKSWFEILTEHFEKIVSDEEFKNNKYGFNTPYTKESYYYRKKFEEYYPSQSHVIPYYWLPNWTNETDPSARKLIF